MSETSAFSAQQWRQHWWLSNDRQRSSLTRNRFATRPLIPHTSMEYGSARADGSRLRPVAPLTADLMFLLPGKKVAVVLVDNYFDRIHWFMLLFHQGEFRKKFARTYTEILTAGDGTDSGYMSVLLSAFIISLQYLSPSRRGTLLQIGVDAEALKDKIISGLRTKLLDILALNSLEAVQMCVLLGTYYLNTGEPAQAWSLCGCGLRLAQALNLHRSVLIPLSGPENRVNQVRLTAEARKRCWWAIYETETFCSMIFGFPLTISDGDCDVDPLDDYDVFSLSANGEATERPTLLSYKLAMSQLSSIIRSTLKDLY